jgi:hypothetical protein
LEQQHSQPLVGLQAALEPLLLHTFKLVVVAVVVQQQVVVEVLVDY